MNTYALYEAPDQTVLRRWGVSAAAILAAHAAVIALGMSWQRPSPAPGVNSPAIMVDLSPVTSSPQQTQLDLAPGPVMQQADASPPEAARQEVVEEQIAPTPPQEKPEVVAPPEQKDATPQKPEPAKAEPEKKPAPVKPKITRTDAKKPTEAPPAPRTTASPRAERQAPAASAASSGASAATLASYQQMVRAHLQRFKQYPPAEKSAGRQGSPRISFTLNRSGGVISVSLSGSSGHSALDAEALAMVRRAQPFPAFPPDIKHSSLTIAAPVGFYIR